VFLVNSRHPLVCAPRPWLPKNGACLSRSYACNLPSSFNAVLSSALVCSTSPPVSVSGTVYTLELFPGPPSLPTQSDKCRQLPVTVTSSRLRNINLIPIGYAFQPRLRGRLTLRRLALRRNPWTFGESVSHMPAFSLPIPPAYLTVHLHRPTERSATTLQAVSTSSVYGFSPGTFSAQDGLFRPVSCYAFFKGWLLLSQPPGCLGLPTSFPT